MAQNAINSKDQVLQFVSSQVATFIDCSTPVIPADDTIPQNTEGTEVLTLAITPKSATSNLLITFNGLFCKGTTGTATVALFQDTTANALTAKCWEISTALGINGFLQYTMTSGTTSSTTFKIRAGPGADVLVCNGIQTGTQLMGGVAATVLTIEEYV